LIGPRKRQGIKAGSQPGNICRAVPPQAQFNAYGCETPNKEKYKCVCGFGPDRLVIDKHDVERHDETQKVNSQTLPENQFEVVTEPF
jgi:hypothetical protein